MSDGRVLEIWVRDEAGGAMHQVTEAELVSGQGIAGDDWRGSSKPQTRPGKQVTLIEQEALDAAAADYGVKLEPGGSRRNLVTVGVALNHLVGREFTVGGTRLRGVRLCEPCTDLEAMTGQPVVKAFRHRGGLRADIVDPGTINVGDPVRG